MIAKIEDAKIFFMTLRSFLYSEASANTVLYRWEKDFQRREISGKKKHHCVHLEIPKDKPIILKATTIRKLKAIPVLEGKQCFCLEQKCKVMHHQKSKLLSGSISVSVYEANDEIWDGYAFLAQKPLVRIHFDRRNEFQEECLCDFSLRASAEILDT